MNNRTSFIAGMLATGLTTGGAVFIGLTLLCGWWFFSGGPPTKGHPLGPHPGMKTIGQKLGLRKRQPLLPAWADSTLPPPEPVLSDQSCSDIPDGGPVFGPDCATARISCGETIIGHTKGGVQRFNTRFYERNFCTPAFNDYNGGDERVYQLEIPPGPHRAFIWLETPCTDLDLAAVRYSSDTCPTDGSLINQCEMWPKKGTTMELVEGVVNDGGTWYVVVEGKNDNEGVFALHVECRQGLQ